MVSSMFMCLAVAGGPIRVSDDRLSVYHRRFYPGGIDLVKKKEGKKKKKKTLLSP